MLIRLILGLVLAGGAYFVAANSHFDIFDCIERKTEDDGRVRVQSDMCSISQVQNNPYPGETAELTPMGYATAVGVLGVLPFLLGMWLGGLFTRKR